MPTPRNVGSPKKGGLMGNVFKALIVTALSLAPVIVKEQFSGHWNWAGYGLFGVIAFLGYWKIVFKPDERFHQVRTPSLDALFDRLFANIRPTDGARFPLRVNVYVPFLASWCPLTLGVAYTWNGQQTDPDYGKWWFSWCGLVGRAYWTSNIAYYRKGDDLSEFRMTMKDQERTDRLEGLLCIPLKRSTKKGSVSGQVTAVLAIDAFTVDAAEQLGAWYDDLDHGRNNPLPKAAAWLSLYF